MALQKIQLARRPTIVDMSNVKITMRKGINQQEYNIFKQNKETLIAASQQRRLTRCTLREAVMMIIQRRHRFQNHQADNTQLAHSYSKKYKSKSIVERANEGEEDVLPEGAIDFTQKADDILKMFKQRDTRGNIVVLKKELKEVQKLQGINSKRGFSFS